MQTNPTIQIAVADDRDAIRELLTANKLPVEDLDRSSIVLYTAKQDKELAAVIGLETIGNSGLLRSMATAKQWRNKGLASSLVQTVLQSARSKGFKTLYLLTETAELFFRKTGFTVISRDEAPAELKQSPEFTHLCPSSATVMKMDIAPMKKVLFVCVENSNRSQMSQAFATILGGATVQAYSAGSKPSGIVNPKAIAAMRELGYDLSTHDSKSLQEVEQYAPFDAVVTMGCGDACPWMPAKKFIDWQIPDPRNMNEAEFREVRDLLKEKVAALLQEL